MLDLLLTKPRHQLCYIICGLFAVTLLTLTSCTLTSPPPTDPVLTINHQSLEATPTMTTDVSSATQHLETPTMSYTPDISSSSTVSPSEPPLMSSYQCSRSSIIAQGRAGVEEGVYMICADASSFARIGTSRYGVLPSVSPDQMSFSLIESVNIRSDATQITIFDLQGNIKGQISSEHHIGSASWSSDGLFIVYTIYISNEFIPAIRHLDTGTPSEQILPQGFTLPAFEGPGDRGFADVEWSPAGSQIALRSTDNTLYILDISCNAAHQCSGIQIRPVIPNIVQSSISWSPDGIYLTAFCRPNGINESDQALCIMDQSGQITDTYSSDELNLDLGTALSPAWSPDGTEIAFVQYSNIWILSLGDRSVKNLTREANINSVFGGIAWISPTY